jgi:hypothetical protein
MFRLCLCYYKTDSIILDHTVYYTGVPKMAYKLLTTYRGCLTVHEKNMEKMFPTKKTIIFIIIINDNTM